MYNVIVQYQSFTYVLTSVNSDHSDVSYTCKTDVNILFTCQVVMCLYSGFTCDVPALYLANNIECCLE